MEEFNALITQLQDATNVFTAQDLILTLVLEFRALCDYRLHLSRHLSRRILQPVFCTDTGPGQHGGGHYHAHRWPISPGPLRW